MSRILRYRSYESVAAPNIDLTPLNEQIKYSFVDDVNTYTHEA